MAKTLIKQLVPSNIDGQIPRISNGLVIWVNHTDTIKNKNLTSNKTFGDNSDSGLVISATPINGGYVEVDVNGLQQILGDGTNAKDYYFITSDVPVYRRPVASGLLKTDYSLWLCGLNDTGAVGDNTTINKSSPVSVVGGHSFIEIFVRSGATPIALKLDGSVWCWGTGSNGQIGDNTTNNRSSPVSVVGAHSFINISTGGPVCGLKADNGSVWCWGLNSTGELGNNTTNDRSSPVSVVGAHSFIDIGSHLAFVIGLKSNSIWTWGSNNQGQLGDNTINDRSSPVSVVGGHLFIKICRTSNNNTSFALKSDGSIWAWGQNGNGLSGDNTTIDRSSPVSVVGGHVFIRLTARAGLKADGSVWMWGLNSSGQLGDNTTNNRSSPVSVVGTHNFTQITSSGAFIFGLKSDGSVWSWGLNSVGQLGDNTTNNRSSPVSVLGPIGSIRSINTITLGDKLIWNGSFGGFDLITSDTIDFNYI